MIAPDWIKEDICQVHKNGPKASDRIHAGVHIFVKKINIIALKSRVVGFIEGAKDVAVLIRLKLHLREVIMKMWLIDTIGGV